MRKILCSLMIMALFLSMLSEQSAFAKGNDDNELHERAKMYGLKDAINIPEGVEVIEIKTVEELDNFMQHIQNSDIYEVEHSTPEFSSINTLGSMQATTTDNDTASVTLNIPGLIIGTTAKLKLEVNFDYSDVIDRVRFTRWSLSGITYCLELANSESDATLRSGVISVTGATDVDYYFLIDGAIKIMSDTYSISYKVSLEKEVHDLRWSKN